MFRTQRLKGSAGLAQPGEDALRRRKGKRGEKGNSGGALPSDTSDAYQIMSGWPDDEMIYEGRNEI